VNSTTWFAAAACLALAGCSSWDWEGKRPGPGGTLTKTIEKSKAEMVKAEIVLGAGDLEIRGGAAQLMEGEFRYEFEPQKPEIRYEHSSFRGVLQIKQTTSALSGLNTWRIRLTDDVPLDLSVKLGAGENRLDLGSLSLRSLEVHMGVGTCRLDLRGKPPRSFGVQIHGGVGEATVYLPRDVGVTAEAQGGIGEIDVRGLRSTGKHTWENELYGKSKTEIRLEVRGGIGAIRLQVE
jgi:hypothetical protein